MIGERTAKKSRSDRICLSAGAGINHGSERPRSEFGLAQDLTIRSEEFREALQEPLSSILESIRLTLERCPPELAADLVDRGIVITGGGALLRGIDRLVAEERDCRCTSRDDPSRRWPGHRPVLQELQFLKRVTSSAK